MEVFYPCEGGVLIHDVSFEVLPFAAHIFLSRGPFGSSSCGETQFLQAFMALNVSSSEADMGWQISVPEDEKMDQMDDDLDLDPQQSHGSWWSRRSSHSVESGTEVTVMDHEKVSCVYFFTLKRAVFDKRSK